MLPRRSNHFSWRTFFELLFHICLFLPLCYATALIYRLNLFRPRVINSVSSKKTKVEIRRVLWQRLRADYPDPMRVRIHAHAGYEDARAFIWNDPCTHVQHLTKDGVVIVRTTDGEYK